MSAEEGPPQLRSMREADLDAVMRVETAAYAFPWTRTIMRDCLLAGYPAWVLEGPTGLIAHGVMSIGAGEAHILNVCTDPTQQGRGHGRRMLRWLLKTARLQRVQQVFLEVRPSNAAAIALYDSEGFNEIGRRPRYYPDHDGRREDAIVMAMELFAD